MRPAAGTPSSQITLALLAAFALMAAGCGRGPAPIPPGLDQAESMPVEKKRFILFTGERVRFGDWSVQKVRRDTTQHVYRPRNSRITVELSETYSFRASRIPPEGGEEAWEGECHSDARRQDEFPLFGTMREKGYRVALKCTLRGPGQASPWTLDLTETDTAGRVLKGSLTGGLESVKVTGSRDRAGSFYDISHTGFEFTADDQLLGAVLLTREDRVLIHPQAAAPMQPALAVASAALILYLDSNRRMKDIVSARLEAERLRLL